MDSPEGPQQKPNIFKRIVDSIKSVFNSTMAVAKALVIKEEIKPTSKRIDFWNLYPDGSCGENIHNGSYVWERDDLTNRQLLDLKGTPGYIDSQIDECIKEGPLRAIAPSKQEPDKRLEGREGDKRFEIWYYHGPLEKAELEAAGCQCEDDDQRPNIPAQVTMVNGRVIRAALNPLDSGDFPYDVMPWQRKSGLPWGNGVARQGRTPQRITTAAVRNLMDNGGISAGPQIVIKQGMITPADGQMVLTPRKIWWVGEDADIDDVSKAMHFFDIPSRQKELMEIIQFGLKLMEDATGLPMLLQGQQGKAPDTVGGMTLLSNNASAVLRRLARTFDDYITEPHIRRYYTWLLQYGDDDEKGDFVIDARGSSALVERDLQAQQIPELLKASLNPVFGLDPKKAMEEHLKSLKFDPKNFKFDDKEWEKVVKGMSEKPQDPRVMVTQLRGEIEGKLQAAEQAFEASENAKDRQIKIAVEMIDERLSTAELSSLERQTLETLKTSLAETSMKLAVTKELAAVDHAVDIHKHHAPPPASPAVEPPGKAKPGKAFQA